MSERDTARREFLQGTGWASWTETALPVDASTRRYFRLSDGNQSVVLMDADPAIGQETAPFTSMAHWLLEHGFAPPRLLKVDAKAGFLMLEDLGHDDFATWSAQRPSETETLYTAATDVLVKLDQIDGVPPLPVMDAEIGGEMLDVTCKWYATSDAAADLRKSMADHLHRLCGPPDQVALRDFHVENLIWRPLETGLARVGLLDFQDAFLAPRGYDLISLLRDVRRDVDQALVAKMTARFISEVRADPDQTNAALACLAVQRNLRILGVFARLAKRDGKRKYLKWVPRVWSLIQSDLQHPELRQLKTTVTNTLPPPGQSAIKDIL